MVGIFFKQLIRFIDRTKPVFTVGRRQFVDRGCHFIMFYKTIRFVRWCTFMPFLSSFTSFPNSGRLTSCVTTMSCMFFLLLFFCFSSCVLSPPKLCTMESPSIQRKSIFERTVMFFLVILYSCTLLFIHTLFLTILLFYLIKLKYHNRNFPVKLFEFPKLQFTYFDFSVSCLVAVLLLFSYVFGTSMWVSQ